MLNFSEILKNTTTADSFLLGMIYAWIILDENKEIILAYNSYKSGTRIKKTLKLQEDNLNEYNEKYLLILQKYLGSKFDVRKNENIPNKYKFSKKINNGISVLLKFDFDIDQNVDKESFILGLIEKAMLEVDKKLENSFIVGFMNGRGSLDFTARYISIDIEKQNKPELTNRKLIFLFKVFNWEIQETNFNPRVLQKKSFKKNDQFRLRIDYFMSEYGLVNPLKIDYFCAEKEIENNGLIPLIVKSKNITENISNFHSGFEINKFAIKLKRKQLTLEEKEKFIAQERQTIGFDSVKHKNFHSNQNVKILAKIQNNYMCEIDEEKESFLSKSNNKNYVEGHHFIPLSKRKNFKVNIDVIENIVCLTPKNHRKIHLAINEEKEPLLKKLYYKKINGLKKVGINISFEDIKNFFDIKS